MGLKPYLQKQVSNVVIMGIGDITVIISILAGMVAIPFAASSVSVADDYKYGLAAVLNSTPEFAANASSSIPSLISKSTSDEGIRYSYRTPYGQYEILISPEKFEETLLKAGKKVSALQSSSEQVWELSLPAESLVINHGNQKITETYRNLNGYLKIVTENGWVSRNKSGTATEEELLAGMLRLEKEMNETISLMKDMSEKILNATPETQEQQQTAQNITINEFLPDPDGLAQDYNKDGSSDDAKDEFVEVYNSGNTNISLANWQLISGSDILIITDVVIRANSSVYFVAGNKSATINGSSAWSGSWTTLLNSGSDSLILKDNNGNIIDSYSYSGSSASRSIGRLPDSSKTWIASMTPTPGSANI